MKDSYWEALAWEERLIEKLKVAREAQGLSYQALADKTGLHRTAISLIERGERHPSLLVCLRLAVALGLKPEELF